MTRNSFMLHTMAISMLVGFGGDAFVKAQWLAVAALLVATVAMCLWFEARLKRAGAVFT